MSKKYPKPDVFDSPAKAVESEAFEPKVSWLVSWNEGFLVRSGTALVDRNGKRWGVRVHCFEEKTDETPGRYRLHLVPLEENDAK